MANGETTQETLETTDLNPHHLSREDVAFFLGIPGGDKILKLDPPVGGELDLDYALDKLKIEQPPTVRWD